MRLGVWWQPPSFFTVSEANDEPNLAGQDNSSKRVADNPHGGLVVHAPVCEPLRMRRGRCEGGEGRRWHKGMSLPTMCSDAAHLSAARAAAIREGRAARDELSRAQGDRAEGDCHRIGEAGVADLTAVELLCGDPVVELGERSEAAAEASAQSE